MTLTALRYTLGNSRLSFTIGCYVTSGCAYTNSSQTSNYIIIYSGRRCPFNCSVMGNSKQTHLSACPEPSLVLRHESLGTRQLDY